MCGLATTQPPALRLQRFRPAPERPQYRRTQETRFHSGKHGVESNCDAECDAFLTDRLEVLARAVVLVAGMKIPEAARQAVLAWADADLARGDAG